jgi:hypothetical protein
LLLEGRKLIDFISSEVAEYDVVLVERTRERVRGEWAL